MDTILSGIIQNSKKELNTFTGKTTRKFITT